MKNLFFVVVTFLLVISIKAQTYDAPSLLIDSMLVQSLNEDFKEESLHRYTIHTKLLHYNHKRQFRSIKIYAYVFEELFRRGFDLNWDIGTTSFRNNSISLQSGPTDTIVSPERRAILKANNENRFRSKLIHVFIRIKDKYERNVIRIDETQLQEGTRTFIDNLILYGNYSQPRVLRKILLGEYEWYNEDLRNR